MPEINLPRKIHQDQLHYTSTSITCGTQTVSSAAATNYALQVFSWRQPDSKYLYHAAIHLTGTYICNSKSYTKCLVHNLPRGIIISLANDEDTIDTKHAIFGNVYTRHEVTSGESSISFAHLLPEVILDLQRTFDVRCEDETSSFTNCILFAFRMSVKLGHSMTMLKTIAFFKTPKGSKYAKAGLVAGGSIAMAVGAYFAWPFIGGLAVASAAPTVRTVVPVVRTAVAPIMRSITHTSLAMNAAKNIPMGVAAGAAAIAAGASAVANALLDDEVDYDEMHRLSSAIPVVIS